MTPGDVSGGRRAERGGGDPAYETVEVTITRHGLDDAALDAEVEGGKGGFAT